MGGACKTAVPAGHCSTVSAAALRARWDCDPEDAERNYGGRLHGHILLRFLLLRFLESGSHS
jgi:hypothetical protein